MLPKVPRNLYFGTNQPGTRDHLDHRILVPAFRPSMLFFVIIYLILYSLQRCEHIVDHL
jgi:hypothetical protein